MLAVPPRTGTVLWQWHNCFQVKQLDLFPLIYSLLSSRLFLCVCSLTPLILVISCFCWRHLLREISGSAVHRLVSSWVDGGCVCLQRLYFKNVTTRAERVKGKQLNNELKLALFLCESEQSEFNPDSNLWYYTYTRSFMYGINTKNGCSIAQDTTKQFIFPKYGTIMFS